MGDLRSTAAGLVVALSVVATANAQAATHASTANGNAFTGGLSFAPADITAAVGDVITWRNTDFIAPHTVTESHGLWDLTGGYGATPANPSGFGPGTVAERRFEAGTQGYVCLVHPADMVGTISIPVTVSATRAKQRRKRGRARTISTVTMIWASEPPATGLGFDVERRVPGGPWSRMHDGILGGSGSFRTRPGTVWEIRARLRSVERPADATGYSPVVSITA